MAQVLNCFCAISRKTWNWKRLFRKPRIDYISISGTKEEGKGGDSPTRGYTPKRIKSEPKEEEISSMSEAKVRVWKPGFRYIGAVNFIELSAPAKSFLEQIHNCNEQEIYCRPCR